MSALITLTVMAAVIGATLGALAALLTHVVARHLVDGEER